MPSPSTAPPLNLILDHLVLTVSSVPATIAWYTTHLQFRHESFVSPANPDIVRHSLLFGTGIHTQKINLHERGREFEPKAGCVRAGSADLCFVTETDVGAVRRRWVLEGEGEGEGGHVEVLKMEDVTGERVDNEGCVVRTGARGRLRSFYCRDLDGNLIEYARGVVEYRIRDLFC
ncbi:MAG: hypothetical protein MMC33_005027 [Icmadophila ericetorum]|nr:hypothetical protein [Icmadophila ericetorum]